jgi:hypothetical protein
MRKAIVAIAAVLVGASIVASPALAFEGGGRKPSEAPLIAVGQHYTGQLNNREADANYGGYKQVAFWRLPPLAARDVVTVSWHELPFASSSGFPVCMIMAQGIDDFNWGTVFGQTSENNSCDESGPIFSVSGSGSAQTQITAQEANSNSSYLEFRAFSNEDEAARFETYPYDFTLQPILHYLGVALSPVKRVSASGYIHASATLATGAPAPDGLGFSLAVSWPGGGTASYTATSSGGGVTFFLALPETAYGKTATFTVSHGADAQYQGATSSELEALVAKPKPPPPPAPTPCQIARRHRDSLARQYGRLRAHADAAFGRKRHRLKVRARRVARSLRSARAETAKACAA